MKIKHFFSIFIVAMLSCVFLLSGCTKADSATGLVCYDKYLNLARKYGRDSSTNEIDVWSIAKSNDKNDLWKNEITIQADLYSSKIAHHVIATDDGKSLNAYCYSVKSLSTEIEKDANYFGLLKYGNEYQTLMDGSSILYKIYSKDNLTTDWSIVSKDNQPKQEDLTKLYLSIEDIGNVSEKLLQTKSNLQVNCKQSTDLINNDSINYIYKDYLKNYSNLIQKTTDLNIIFEKILLTTKPVGLSTDGKVISGETKRLVASSILYLTEFYYQKHFVLNDDSNNMFAHQMVGEVENENCDKDFLNYKALLASCENIGDVSKEMSYYYLVALDRLDGIRLDIKNYENAIKNVNEYKNTNNVKTIPTDSICYNYVKFINDFETKIIDFQNFIYNNFAK